MENPIYENLTYEQRLAIARKFYSFLKDEANEKIQAVRDCYEHQFNPCQTYEQIVQKHDELNRDRADKIRTFRVVYKDTDGVKSVRSLTIQFQNEKRAACARENGKRGGRPHSPTASLRSILRRKTPSKSSPPVWRGADKVGGVVTARKHALTPAPHKAMQRCSPFNERGGARASECRGMSKTQPQKRKNSVLVLAVDNNSKECYNKKYAQNS